MAVHDIDVNALAPARSVSATCSPRRLKSAARIDGAMWTMAAPVTIQAVNCYHSPT